MNKYTAGDMVGVGLNIKTDPIARLHGDIGIVAFHLRKSSEEE